MDNTYFYCPCFYFPKHNGWDCTIAATKHWHGVLEKDALLPEYNAHKIMHNAGQRNSKGRRRRIYQRRLKIQHNTKDANSKCGLWKFWLRCKFTFSNVISRNSYSQYLHLSSRLQGDSADSEYQKSWDYVPWKVLKHGTSSILFNRETLFAPICDLLWRLFAESAS